MRSTIDREPLYGPAPTKPRFRPHGALSLAFATIGIITISTLENSCAASLINIKLVVVENKTADPIVLRWINVLWLSPSQFAVYRARCSSPGSEIAMKSMIEESNWAPFLSALVVVAIATTIIVWLMPPNF